MESVQKYYRHKANIQANDEYLERINEGDIDMMRKAFAGIVVAPFLSVLAMYCAKELKKDTSMSENFVYNIRRFQDRVMPNNATYARSTEQTMTPEFTHKKEDVQKEAENLKNLYKTIKDEDSIAQAEQT